MTTQNMNAEHLDFSPQKLQSIEAQLSEKHTGHHAWQCYHYSQMQEKLMIILGP